jgi:hypothetical protein
VEEAREQAGVFTIERGAGWHWLTGLDERYREGVVVIAPQAGESEAALGARIARRWQQLRREGKHVSLAGMACSDAAPQPSLLSRATRARRLLTELLGQGGGQLVLMAESAALRHTLIAIAGVLASSLEGAPVHIRVFAPGTVYETSEMGAELEIADQRASA